MKKRILTGLLALLLLFSGGTCASAKTILKLWDVSWNDVDKAFWQEHPELGYKDVSYHPFEEPLGQMLQKEPDVTLLRLYNDDLNRFIQAGLLADLSSSQAIVQTVSRMPAWLQELVTTDDGQILALPTSARMTPFYWYQDAWDAAGLTQDDVPQSYTELLDFLDEWARNPVKGVCAGRLWRWNTGTEKYNYMYWLTQWLVRSHEMQQRYAGEAVRFETPAFIELARRTRETGLALYKAEPRQKKRAGMLQLFHNSYCGYQPANNGLPHGMSHAIPMRLTNDQPKLQWVSVKVVFIRQGTPAFEEALLFVERLPQNQYWEGVISLYTDFAPGDYPFGRKTAHVDEGWLADYRDYDGVYVAYPLAHSETHKRSGISGPEKLMMQFFEGAISAETYARKLDELLQ